MKVLRIWRWVAAPALLVFAGCATAGHPCFSERVMFPDRSASCQYGRAYQCDNGDWIADRQSCTAAAPQLAATVPVGSCEYDGISFASGSASCNAGYQYRCDNGRWTSLGKICTLTNAATVRVAPSGTGCSYEGTTVSSSSAICQSGTTFVCNDGQWINLGTTCG